MVVRYHFGCFSACCSQSVCLTSSVLFLSSCFCLCLLVLCFFYLSVFIVFVVSIPLLLFWFLLLLPLLCFSCLIFTLLVLLSGLPWFLSVLFGSFCPVLSAAICLWCGGTAGSQSECSQSGTGGQHPSGERCTEDKPSSSRTGNKPGELYLETVLQNTLLCTDLTAV